MIHISPTSMILFYLFCCCLVCKRVGFFLLPYFQNIFISFYHFGLGSLFFLPFFPQELSHCPFQLFNDFHFNDQDSALFLIWLHIRVTSNIINLFLPLKAHLGPSICNWMGKTLEKKMSLTGCEQQVGNHWTKEWFCGWNPITFMEMRDLQGLFNLILLPWRLTYSWCVRNAIFQMTSSPVTKSGPCKVLDLFHVWVFETLILSFPMCWLFPLIFF